MCSTLAIASVLATLGGTYMQYKSQRDAQDDMQDAAQAESIRQSKMDEQKYAEFQRALSEAQREGQQENIDEAAQELETDYANAVADEATTYSSPAASGAPKIVKQYADERDAEGDDFVAQLGKARAKRGAWGENLYEFGNNMLDRQFNLGQLQTNMNRSAQIGEFEARMAGQPGAGAAIGNALTGLGTAGLGYAGSRGDFANLLPSAKGSASVMPGVPVPNNATAQSIPLGENWWPSYSGTNI